MLRFDSLSKILSAGIRMGWVTGPKPLIERIVLHSQTSSLHISGVSQMMTLALLREWGIEGFLAHVDQVTAFYERKRDAFLQSCSKHLTGLVEWDTPQAGMFVWLKLVSVADSRRLIQEKAVEAKIVLVPGFEFFAAEKETNFVRASYSTASEEEIETALERLASLLRE